jgi:hypothetical protein
METTQALQFSDWKQFAILPLLFLSILASGCKPKKVPPQPGQKTVPLIVSNQNADNGTVVRNVIITAGSSKQTIALLGVGQTVSTNIGLPSTPKELTVTAQMDFSQTSAAFQAALERLGVNPDVPRSVTCQAGASSGDPEVAVVFQEINLGSAELFNTGECLVEPESLPQSSQSYGTAQQNELFQESQALLSDSATTTKNPARITLEGTNSRQDIGPVQAISPNAPSQYVPVVSLQGLHTLLAIDQAASSQKELNWTTILKLQTEDHPVVLKSNP